MNAMNTIHCASCSRTYPESDRRWSCYCGGLLDWRPVRMFPLDSLSSRGKSLWRYRESLPESCTGSIVSFGEGMTPLVPFTLQGDEIQLKLDYIMPTGSFKDRGSAVLISHCAGQGIESIVEDSSGNAGASIAAYAARAGIRCDIYVPAGTTPAKCALISSAGARLHTIEGARSAAESAALKAAKTSYYASHAHNPFFIAGTMTAAYEICEQLDWHPPDTVVVPAGNGTLLLGLYRGFQHLHDNGAIPSLPKCIVVQPVNCSPLYQAFQSGADSYCDITCLPTFAEGTAVARPVRLAQMLDAVSLTGGQVLAVEEHEIMQACHDMWHNGFMIEPTSALAIAGLSRYLSYRHESETIVAVLTGHGMKTTSSGAPIT